MWWRTWKSVSREQGVVEDTISVDSGDYANSSGMTERVVGDEGRVGGRDFWALRVVTWGMKFSTPLEFNAINVGLNHEVL